MKENIIKIAEFSKEEFIALLREAFPEELFKSKNDSALIDDEFLTRQQTSKLLNVSFTTLFHWNNENVLKARKMGRKVYYLKQDVIDKLKNVA